MKDHHLYEVYLQNAQGWSRIEDYPSRHDALAKALSLHAGSKQNKVVVIKFNRHNMDRQPEFWLPHDEETVENLW